MGLKENTNRKKSRLGGLLWYNLFWPHLFLDACCFHLDLRRDEQSFNKLADKGPGWSVGLLILDGNRELDFPEWVEEKVDENINGELLLDLLQKKWVVSKNYGS